MCKRSEEEEGLCLLHDLCGCLKRGEEREKGDIWHYHVLLWAVLKLPTQDVAKISVTFSISILIPLG